MNSPMAPLAARAFEIARSIAHPPCDCFYLALAEHRGARLVTAERKFLARMAATPWAPLLIGLGAPA